MLLAMHAGSVPAQCSRLEDPSCERWTNRLWIRDDWRNLTPVSCLLSGASYQLKIYFAEQGRID